MVAVSVPTTTIAVRVMGSMKLVSEVDVVLISEELEGEMKERTEDSAVGLGSTVTVTVPIPLVTVTMEVRVLRPVELAVGGTPVDEPVDSVVEAVVDMVEDESSSSASGIEPRISLARVMSVQPKIAPSVVSMGMARQAVSASEQRSIFQAPSSAQVATPPARHATWP